VEATPLQWPWRKRFLGFSLLLTAPVTCDKKARMKTTRTIVCKLAPTSEQALEIDAALGAFAAACNHIAEVCRTIESTNKVIVQHACYREVRAIFGLSANLAIRAIARVCTALKVQEKVPSTFEPTSVDFDQRIFRFRESDWTFGLTLLNGREQIATVLGQRQKAFLKGQKPTSAVLVKRRDGGYFLHVPIDADVPEPPEAEDFLGVDLGIANIATDSEGQRHSGEDVERVRKKHHLQRQRLQRKGTKGAHKKIRRIQNKEARFRRHQNHVISKEIVQTAKRTGCGIALEDLKGIRQRVTARGGDAKNRLGSWSFAQLGAFLVSKAQLAAVMVEFVNPRSTSQTCAECGHRRQSNRKSQAAFECKACGHQAHADANAARNIRAQAISVRQGRRRGKLALELGTPARLG
jgi:putative transposase